MLPVEQKQKKMWKSEKQMFNSNKIIIVSLFQGPVCQQNSDN